MVTKQIKNREQRRPSVLLRVEKGGQDEQLNKMVILVARQNSPDKTAPIK